VTAPPDFEQIARHIYDTICVATRVGVRPLMSPTLESLTKELHQVWNARGEADAQVVNEAKEEVPDPITRLTIMTWIRGLDEYIG
jgi:hypothetical protein